MDTVTLSTTRAYDHVRNLLHSLGGEMSWVGGGAHGGGTWHLSLHGKTCQVPVRNNHVNDLDRLYVANTENPTTWADYDHPGTLRPDAFWRLISLFLFS